MKISSVSTNYASERLIENLKKAEDLIVPRVEILELKKEVKVKSDDYKSLTKKLKKRVNLLRNQKLATEAEEIDNYASQRDIINLFKSMKS